MRLFTQHDFSSAHFVLHHIVARVALQFKVARLQVPITEMAVSKTVFNLASAYRHILIDPSFSKSERGARITDLY